MYTQLKVASIRYLTLGLLLVPVALYRPALAETYCGQALQLDASDGAAIGRAVAVHGDRIVATSPQAAHVFKLNGARWIDEAQIVPDLDHGSFGQSIAFDGSALAVGSPAPWGSDELGTVYYYQRVGDRWVPQHFPPSRNSFGTAVALSGNRILIGSRDTAEVFVRKQQAWLSEGLLLSGFPVTGTDYGRSVALSDDTAVVGAPKNDAVYVFARSNEEWKLEVRLRRQGLSASSLALFAETLFVGAPESGARGTVFVYERSVDGGTARWQLREKLTVEDDVAGFGQSIVVNGSTLVATAPNGPEPSVYFFGEEAGSWTRTTRLTLNDFASVPSTFTQVSIDRGMVVIGATAGQQNERYTTHLVCRSPAVHQLDRVESEVEAARDVLSKLNDDRRFTGDAELEAHGIRMIAGVSQELERLTDDAELEAHSARVIAEVDENKSLLEDVGSKLDLVQSKLDGTHTLGDVVELTSADEVPAGRMVAISGDRLVTISQQAAHVFRRRDAQWEEEDRIERWTQASQSAPISPRSVALDGSTLALGARGKVYFFTHRGSYWEQGGVIDKGGDDFGGVIALSGDRALVGYGSYRALIFERRGQSWEPDPIAEISPPEGDDTYPFGGSLAIDGGIAVAGSRGAAHVFELGNSGWVRTARIERAGESSFGERVAISNGRLAIGAADAIYIYHHEGNGWQLQTSLTAADKASIGKMFAIGGSSLTALSGQGTVHIFTEWDGAWIEEGRQELSDSAGALASVAVWSDTVVIGTSDSTYVLDRKPSIDRRLSLVESRLDNTVGRVASRVVAEIDQNEALLTAFSGEETLIDVLPLETVHGDIGRAVAMSGGRVIAMSSDAAHIFRRDGLLWVEEARVEPSVGCRELGRSLAFDGGTLAIGATKEPFTGAVFLFARTPGGWQEQGWFEGGSGYASSVALYGDRVLVGGGGQARIYVRDGSNWSLEAELFPDDDVAPWGESVALGDGTAVVAGQESVHIFRRSGTGWQHQEKLNREGEAGFGLTIALSGETLVIGGAGAAYVYADAGESWHFRTMLVASEEPYQVGRGIAISGGTVATTTWQGGALHLFAESGGTWFEETLLSADELIGSSGQIRAVAIHGDTVVVGAESSYGSYSTYLVRYRRSISHRLSQLESRLYTKPRPPVVEAQLGNIDKLIERLDDTSRFTDDDELTKQSERLIDEIDQNEGRLAALQETLKDFDPSPFGAALEESRFTDDTELASHESTIVAELDANEQRLEQLTWRLDHEDRFTDDREVAELRSALLAEVDANESAIAGVASRIEDERRFADDQELASTEERLLAAIAAQGPILDSLASVLAEELRFTDDRELAAHRSELLASTTENRRKLDTLAAKIDDESRFTDDGERFEATAALRTDLEVVLAEVRTNLAVRIEDNLASGSCRPWMYLPEFLETEGGSTRVGGHLEQVLKVIESVIVAGRLVGYPDSEALEIAEASLHEARSIAAQRPPLDGRSLCRRLLKAFAHATGEEEP
jgi:hypothetical protein